MARRLGRQVGDRRDNFSRQSFFLLAMATKTVAAWSAVMMYIKDLCTECTAIKMFYFFKDPKKKNLKKIDCYTVD